MRKIIFITWVFVLLMLGCGRNPEHNVVRVPTFDGNDIPIISYYIHRHIENPELSHLEIAVIVSLMKDGTLIWSKSESGGPPYYKSKLKPEEVASSMKYFENQTYFELPTCHINYASIHDDLPTIVILNNSQYIYMINSHVLWEKNHSDMVGTSQGVRSVKLQDQNSIDKLRTEEYLEFRRNWDDIASYLLALRPNQGEKIDIESKQISTNLQILSTDIDY